MFYMGPVRRTDATLRISGDDLNPADVSHQLGCQPTSARVTGKVRVGEQTGTEGKAHPGIWRLQAAARSPENLNGQVNELLGQLTSDLEVWHDLARRYRIDLFCGVFLGSGNEGLELSPDSLMALGQRGIKLGLDIYTPE